MMNNDNDKPITQEEAEENFKNAVADIFSKQIPGGVYRDENGFIVIPRVRRSKKGTTKDKP